MKPGDAFHLATASGLVYSRAIVTADPNGGVFLGYETRPATSVLPLVLDANGRLEGGIFVREHREIEGVTDKATGNYNKLNESDEASAQRCLSTKLGIIVDPRDLVPVYPHLGIGTQFVFKVKGYLAKKNWRIDEAIVLPANCERIYLSKKEMLVRLKNWQLFGDDTYRLVMRAILEDDHPELFE